MTDDDDQGACIARTKNVKSMCYIRMYVLKYRDNMNTYLRQCYN